MYVEVAKQPRRGQNSEIAGNCGCKLQVVVYCGDLKGKPLFSSECMWMMIDRSYVSIRPSSKKLLPTIIAHTHVNKT